MNFKKTLLVTASLLAATTGMAHAQDATSADASDQAPASGLKDIVVTARRSTERLMDVPVAVSAIPAEALAKADASNLTKVADLVPFVTFTRIPSGNGGQFIIRGIGSPGFDSGIQQTVLVNLDGVLVSRGRIVNQGTFDLGQVEVLKGPQALFFGKNSPAGVVSVNSADPTSDFSGYVRGGYEFVADERYVEGAVSTALTDALSVRAAGRYSKMDGWLRNVAVARANPLVPAIPIPGASHPRDPGGEDIGARLTLAFKPSPEFSAKLKYTYGHSRTNGAPTQYENYCAPGITTPSDLGIPDVQGDCRLDRVKAVADFPAAYVVNMPGANNGIPTESTTSHLASLNMSYTGETFGIDSITGYYKLNNLGTGNYNQTTLPLVYAVTYERSHAFSQELRLTSRFEGMFNVLLGGYFSSETNFIGSATFLAPLPLDPATGKVYTYDRFGDVTTKTYSVFGQARLQLRENLELAGGLRYTHEKKTSLDGNTFVNPAFAANLRPAGALFDRTFSDDNVSPEVTLTWKATPDQTIYAAYKTGYKSGGFSYPSVLTPIYTSANTTFASETARGGEVGYKALVANRTLRLQLTGYQYTFSNLQESSFDAPTISFIVGNAAKARTRGVELEANYQPSSALSLNFSAGYNDARFLSFLTAPCTLTGAGGCTNGKQDLSGKTLPRAPKWQGSLNASYRVPVGDYDVSLGAGAKYTSSFISQDNYDPNSRQGEFVKVDASIAIGPQDERWSLSLIGRNLTNRYTKVFSLDKVYGQAGEYNAIMSRPREVRVEGSFKF